VSSPLLAALIAGLALGAVMALAALFSRKQRSEREAKAYLAGFTYVLSDEPDAAIAELSRAAQLNHQTLETYFALGALFHRKGDLERAVRLHRNILLRSGISSEVKRRALLCLGLDYKIAGLRDQAVETFERLLEEDPKNREGLLHYRRLLEEAREWRAAISVQTRLVRIDARGGDVLAHLLAEAARAALTDGSADGPELAERFSEQGVRLHGASADAHLALGEAQLARGIHLEAAESLCKAMALEPELATAGTRLLALAAPGQVESFLSRQVERGGETVAAYELALARHLRTQGKGDQARMALRRLLAREPELWEARRELGALLLERDRSEELRADYQQILGTLGRPAPAFICGACSQRLPEHGFRCPRCEAWDSIRREPRATPLRQPWAAAMIEDERTDPLASAPTQPHPVTRGV
jgi:lipopolysaccharide biosynthesis regulator YciM